MTIQQACEKLRKGLPVAFPTETVYGLGASIFSEEAILKIFALKKRPSDNPLIVHISNLKQLSLIVESYPECLVNHFWPGPLTLILRKKDIVPSLVSAGLSTIGVRMPAHPMARALIEAFDEPLAAPSANVSGKPSSTTARHVREDFGEEVFILDGGPCTYGLESTVLALNPPTILRPGAIKREELENFLQEKVFLATNCNERPASPGMKYKHYAPKAKVRLVFDDNPILVEPNKMIINDVRPHNLYALFRKADQDGFDEIVVMCNRDVRSDEALMNRLIRAAQ